MTGVKAKNNYSRKGSMVGNELEQVDNSPPQSQLSISKEDLFDNKTLRITDYNIEEETKDCQDLKRDEMDKKIRKWFQRC